MDVGALSSGFLTGLREGVEAALIVAIICAYLAKTGNQREFPKVFAGAGLAIACERGPRDHPLRHGGRFRGAVRADLRGDHPVRRGGGRDLDAVLDAASGAYRQG